MMGFGMSAPAPNNQNDGLGRGKRTTKATTKAQAIASSTAQGSLNAQHQAPTQAPVQTPAQSQAPVQSQAPAAIQSHAPAQTQNSTQPERRQTRSQTTAAPAQTNTVSNAAQSQATSSGQLPQPTSRTPPRKNGPETTKRRVTPKTIDDVMIKIYEEIHEVATAKYTLTGDDSKYNLLYWASYLIFQARLFRFFDVLSQNDRTTLKGLLTDYNSNSERQMIAGEVQ